MRANCSLQSALRQDVKTGLPVLRTQSALTGQYSVVVALQVITTVRGARAHAELWLADRRNDHAHCNKEFRERVATREDQHAHSSSKFPRVTKNEAYVSRVNIASNDCCLGVQSHQKSGLFITAPSVCSMFPFASLGFRGFFLF